MVNPRVRVQIVRYSITALSGAAYYLANDTFLERKKDIKLSGGFFRYMFAGKKEGIIIKDLKTTPYLESLIESAKKDYEGCEKAKDRVKFSLYRKSEPINFGSSLTGKAFVVLPEYLNVRSVNELNAAKVNAMLEETYEWTVPRTEMWFTDYGKLLVDSFLLSDAAKKYVIAKEMASTFNYDTYMMSFLLMGSMTIFNLMVSMFEKRKKAVHPREMFPSVILCAITAFMFFSLMKFQRNLVREQSGNLYATTRGRGTLQEAAKKFREFEKMDNVDSTYHQGGVEYYSKLVQRHLAMRNLIRSLPYSMSNPVINDDGSWKKHTWTLEHSAPDTLKDLHDWAEGRERTVSQKKQLF